MPKFTPMKEIVDSHFIAHLDYYKSYCQYSYRGRYLWEDLLQETYLNFLRVKPDVLQKYSDNGRLTTIGRIIIRSLYQDRKRAKKNKNGNTSPLFEINGYSDDTRDCDTNYFEIEQAEIDFEECYNKALKLFERALSEPVSQGKEKSSFLKVKTFLAVQESNIYQISKQTGINRKYITDVYNEAREYIKKEIA